MWHNCIRMTNNQYIKLIVTIYRNDLLKNFTLPKIVPPWLPFCQSPVGNDWQKKSQIISRMEMKHSCLGVLHHLTTTIGSVRWWEPGSVSLFISKPDQSWSWFELSQHWKQSISDLFQIWLIWDQNWAAMEYITYARHLDWETRVRGTQWCHCFWVGLLDAH